MYPPAGAAPQPTGLQLSAKDVKDWWARIELDRAARKRNSENWRELYRQYLPRKDGGKPVINSNIHFRNVSLKSAQLWAQLPNLILQPLKPMAGILDPSTGQPYSPDDVVAVKRAVLMKLLGRNHANVDQTVRAGLFDVLQTSGMGPTKICYESDIHEMQQQVPGPPMAAPGSVLGLAEVPGPPTMQMVPVVVHERVRWYHFSPDKLLIPYDYSSTLWDESPYLGMEFIEPLTEAAKKKYKLPPDFQSNVTRDDLLLTRDINSDLKPAGTAKLFKGVELWIYASRFDPAQPNSQVMYRLVLIEGMKDKAAIYELSPYQQLDERGILTPASMIGNPIHPLSIRVASDTAYVPSDAAFTDPLVRIENTMMAQDMKVRDANIPRFFHSSQITAAVDKLKDMDAGQGAAVPHDVMMQGVDKLIAEIPHMNPAPSDEAMRDHVAKANEQTLGISPNQGGGFTSTVRSATESAIVQQNINVRMKDEQNQLMEWFLAGVRKFDSLIQQFWDANDYVQIVGQDGTMKLMAYSAAHLQGAYAFDAFPDSQLTNDNASKIQRFETFVNFLAKSGWLNMGGVAREWTNLMGYDAASMVSQPQPPPEPPPDKPKVSVALKASDLAIPEVLLLLKAEGIDLTMLPTSPELAAAHAQEQAKNQPHGGAADQVDKVDKHQSTQSGNQDGQPPLAPAEAMPQALPPGMGPH
jgi:hypothetical protein